MKELRFSIQCGASNRKSLATRRCSQCTVDQISTEFPTINQQQLRRRSYSNRSSSSASMNFGTSLQSTKHRTTSDLSKCDTLLMLTAERTNRLDTLHKLHQRYSSTSPQLTTLPLILVEQKRSNHARNVRPPHVRFIKSASTFYFLQ
jgi:hypothetical protein